MSWIEVSLKVESDQANQVAATMGQAAQSTPAIEQEPDSPECTVRAYIARGRSARERIEEVRRRLAVLDTRYPELLKEKSIKQEDWFAPIKQGFTTLDIGNKLRIKASWASAPEDDRITLEIDPGYAFGTGLHPTTHMCLTEIEKCLVRGMSALDLGTGSGILAIAAARLGARHVLALDTDSNAVYAAARNVTNNNVSDTVQVRRGTLSLAVQKKQADRYDLVVANIVAPVISALAGRFWRVLKPDGILIASGIIAAGLDEVLISLALAGFTLQVVDHEGDWCTIVARKLTEKPRGGER
jgi:ribosomal protein L11 methyltransferase